MQQNEEAQEKILGILCFMNGDVENKTFIFPKQDYLEKVPSSIISVNSLLLTTEMLANSNLNNNWSNFFFFYTHVLACRELGTSEEKSQL